MNDLNLEIGEPVQMTVEGRRMFRAPYTGVVKGVGGRGGLSVLRFGETSVRSFRPRYWERLETGAGEKVICPACGVRTPIAEMDECVACSRPYELCPKCLLSHPCGGFEAAG